MIAVYTVDFKEPLPDDNNKGRRQRGYPIHTRCWTLIERILGPRVEEKLGLLVEALQQRWYERNAFELLDWKTDKHRWLCIRQFKHIHWLMDPVKISGVRSLLNVGFRGGGPREGMRWKTRRWSRVASRNESNVIITVPLDVKLLILDYLDHKAIRNTIAALGWEIPDSYWRSRFPRDLIFEVEEIGTREIDWQYLFLKIESLLKNSDALLNRRRIMKVLEGTKKIFLQLTEGEQIEGTI